MRIAIGQLAHETNTFCQGTTPVASFKAREWTEGDGIVAYHRGVRSYLGGMLDAADRLGVEAVPTLSTWAEPSGTIAADAYAAMYDGLLGRLRSAGPLDAVCLALHGAGVAEGADDLEGDLLRRVREVIGPDLPLVVTLDLHGNVTPAMAEHADALLGNVEYPHVDSYERGVEAVELAARMVRRESQPAMALVRLPMMIPTTTSFLEPVKGINALCAAWEAKAGVIDCTLMHGFSHTDIPEVCVSVIAIAEGDAALAETAARDVAATVWALREHFRPQLTAADAAIRRALAASAGPVVIHETADNPGGGAPGDATHLLRAMLDANLENACFGFITDPETAEQAHRAGAGATIDVRLGGKYDALHGAPIEARAYVKTLTDGQFVFSTPMMRGARYNLGKMARLQIGGIDVIVSSVRSQTLDQEVFLLHGVDVTRYKVVALKSSQHFRAGFTDLATDIIRADTPGLTSVDLTVFDYRRLTRPIWPLDEAASYTK